MYSTSGDGIVHVFLVRCTFVSYWVFYTAMYETRQDQDLVKEGHIPSYRLVSLVARLGTTSHVSQIEPQHRGDVAPGLDRVRYWVRARLGLLIKRSTQPQARLQKNVPLHRTLLPSDIRPHLRQCLNPRNGTQNIAPDIIQAEHGPGTELLLDPSSRTTISRPHTLNTLARYYTGPAGSCTAERFRVS